MLYVVRHGLTDWNREPARCQGWQDAPLNETGRGQARRLMESFLRKNIQTVYASPLKRALETAVVIVHGLGCPMKIDDRLAETYRGDWEGMTFSDIQRTDPEGWRCYRERPHLFRFPNGESLKEHQNRAISAVAQILAEQKGDVVVVTHGGTIRLILCHLKGLDLTHFHDFQIENGGIIPFEGFSVK